MRVALVTTAIDQPTRGNHTTVQRWLRHARGVDLRVWDPAQTPADWAPDLFVGYHALHGGEPARALAAEHGKPLVVSLGGTDAQDLAAGGDAGERVRVVLESATRVNGAVRCFGPLLARTLGRAVPYDCIPRGVELPAMPVARRPHDPLHVLLPAGLRPVKDPLLALDLAEELVARGVNLELRILGPVLDDEYARRVLARAGKLAYASVGSTPPDRMHEQYTWADVVWNTSLHEGGANAILEAAARGCDVFARDVTGNRDMLDEPGAVGALWDGVDLDAAEQFHRAVAASSATDHAERVARGRAWLSTRHDPAAEFDALLRCWRLSVAD